jgi:hypothetical protein
MATARWRAILHTEQGYCEEFVRVMQCMDPRYRGFTVDQLVAWLDPNDRGPYKGDRVEAFAWFPDPSDMTDPKRMQTVVLARYHPGASTADVFMLGWCPWQRQINSSVLDQAIDEILDKGVEWLRAIDPTGNLKTICTVRPNNMASTSIKRMHDEIYNRAAVAVPPPAKFIQLQRERDLGDAKYLELAIIP